MNQNPEQLNQLIAEAQKQGTSPDSLISALMSIPKAHIPSPDLLRVKAQILDRISLPSSMRDEQYSTASKFLGMLPRFLRITGGIVGAFTIMLSLMVGTAAVSLEAVPGQSTYPLKKMVETVRLQFAGSDEQRTALQIKFANNRVDELEAILQQQKEGKISESDVQKIVAETAKNIEETSQAVNNSDDQNKLNLLIKIVDLSNKQTAVIQGAQVQTDSMVQSELEKALESSKLTKEQAIENIEKAGLVVEEQPLTLEDPNATNENAVTTEGKLTAVSDSSVSIGTVKFLLTKDTEYVNITREDLAVDMSVKIMGEVENKKTYALKIEAEEPVVPEETRPTNSDGNTVTPNGIDQSGSGTQSPADVVPIDPEP